MAQFDATVSKGDPAVGRELLERFLANRPERTVQAYTADIAAFARFLNRAKDAAVAGFLDGGPTAGRRVVLDYTVDLRRQGLAEATIDRRLGTLRALTRAAQDLRLIDWSLELPTEDQVAAAIQELSTGDSVRYLLPRHPGEIDRLDIQHYGLRETLGANYLAPIEAPQKVLDAGCGTGQWGFEVCMKFPRALVIGLDLVAGKLDRPPRYGWVKGNLLQGLPFAADQFDFVHQRLLVTGVPVASWRAVVADLVRVTLSGGWVELVEPSTLDQQGPATERLLELTAQIAASLGLDTTSVVFDSLDRYLRRAGLRRVVRRQISVPIGRWGGQVGSLMVTDLRAGFTRVCEVLQKSERLTAEEGRDLIRRAQQEWEHGRMSWTFAIAYGRKRG
jgi:ubiquinone/menaquinone biosynthesis C-methylase UbiE